MNHKKFLALKAKREAEIQQKQQQAAQGPYELSMTFCIDEVNSVVDEYREEQALEDEEMTPEHVAYSVYHGDLIICLKNLLIPLDQEWHLGVDSHYYNPETDEVMTVPVQFQMPKMNFNEFKFGSKLSVDRGHGLKTRWRGINEELNEILLADVPVGFNRVRSDAKLSCLTGFTDYNCLKEFNFVKKVMRTNGLEGIKKVNEVIAQYKEQQVA
ncbi:hypothetical protein ABLT80_09130 [Acinetobacter schindleri]|uniref:hypothetical protein n=1 Tax=Acinetobacter schindleri TaxID=108981 RepID=UPI0022F39B4C|nr:hypothetical protein [Acinetobacter schindleri]WBX39008.1 hypothetical protein MYA84_05020 [Acinetobacter schindleri]